MKGKHLLLLVVLLGAIIAAAIYLQREQATPASSASSTRGALFLEDFPVNDVAQIALRAGESQLTLKKGEEGWKVAERQGYPADFSKIRDVLLALKELKIVQSIPVGRGVELERFGLEEVGETEKEEASEKPRDPAVNIEFFDGEGKSLHVLWLGDLLENRSAQPAARTQFSTRGRYLFDAARSDQVVLVGEGFANLVPDARTWLDKSFFKIEKLKSIAVTPAQEGAEKWRVSRRKEGEPLELKGLAEEEQPNAQALNSLENFLAYADFVDVITDQKKSELGLDAPTKVVVTTFDGFTYSLHVGDKLDQGDYPLSIRVRAKFPEKRKVEGEETEEEAAKRDAEFAEAQKALREKLEREQQLEKHIYRVPQWSVSPVLQKRADLIMPPAGDAETEGGFPETG